MEALTCINYVKLLCEESLPLENGGRPRECCSAITLRMWNRDEKGHLYRLGELDTTYNAQECFKAREKVVSCVFHQVHFVYTATTRTSKTMFAINEGYPEIFLGS
jgi:hypothetical protein